MQPALRCRYVPECVVAIEVDNDELQYEKLMCCRIWRRAMRQSQCPWRLECIELGRAKCYERTHKDPPVFVWRLLHDLGRRRRHVHAHVHAARIREVGVVQIDDAEASWRHEQLNTAVFEDRARVADDIKVRSAPLVFWNVIARARVDNHRVIYNDPVIRQCMYRVYTVHEQCQHGRADTTAPVGDAAPVLAFVFRCRAVGDVERRARAAREHIVAAVPLVRERLALGRDRQRHVRPESHASLWRQVFNDFRWVKVAPEGNEISPVLKELDARRLGLERKRRLNDTRVTIASSYSDDLHVGIVKVGYGRERFFRRGRQELCRQHAVSSLCSTVPACSLRSCRRQSSARRRCIQLWPRRWPFEG